MNPRVVVSISRYYGETAGRITEIILPCEHDYEVEPMAQRAEKAVRDLKVEAPAGDRRDLG